MRLHHAWVGNNGKPITLARKPGKNGESRSVVRWQVRWLLNIGPGLSMLERKTSKFETKGAAEAFIKELQKAHFRFENFYFDDNGWPTDIVVSPTSVLDALTEYVEGRWSTVWKPNQRTKVRGRLLQLIAITTRRPADQAKLLEGLERQRSDRGERPLPTCTVEWAARWLRDHALIPGAEATEPQVLAGKKWLEQNSMSLTALAPKEITRLRLFFTEGRDYSTQRTYWKGAVVPFLTWLYRGRKVEFDLTLDQPSLKRDMQGERPDPSRIPNPNELAAIAKELGVAHGPKWELFVWVAGYCALRISEAFAIRYDSFIVKDGRLWLSVSAQEHRIVGSSSDDGLTRKVRTGTKSTRDRTPRPRVVPIPASLTKRLEEYCGDRLGRDSDYLFTGPRGAIANDTTVRAWWHEAVARALPDHPVLTGIKPHVLRHAGMTYWYAGKNDEKRIQMWGGWTSLTQMNETYRGVVDSLEHIDLEGLDRFAEMFHSDEAVTPDTVATTTTQAIESCVVISLDDYRRRRLA